jgi:hypothetical protein
MNPLRFRALLWTVTAGRRQSEDARPRSRLPRRRRNVLGRPAWTREPVLSGYALLPPSAPPQ